MVVHMVNRSQRRNQDHLAFQPLTVCGEDKDAYRITPPRRIELDTITAGLVRF
jgi:hypothetical protein